MELLRIDRCVGVEERRARIRAVHSHNEWTKMRAKKAIIVNALVLDGQAALDKAWSIRKSPELGRERSQGGIKRLHGALRTDVSVWCCLTDAAILCPS